MSMSLISAAGLWERCEATTVMEPANHRAVSNWASDRCDYGRCSTTLQHPLLPELPECVIQGWRIVTQSEEALPVVWTCFHVHSSILIYHRDRLILPSVNSFFGSGRTRHRLLGIAGCMGQIRIQIHYWNLGQVNVRHIPKRLAYRRSYPTCPLRSKVAPFCKKMKKKHCFQTPLGQDFIWQIGFSSRCKRNLNYIDFNS